MANTTTLTLDVTEQQLELVTDTMVASGGLNDIVLHFNFKDDTWDGLSLKAVFQVSGEETAYAVTVLSSNATVPHEVMQRKCTVFVALAGSIVDSKGVATLVRTSAVYGLRLERGAAVEFEPSADDERYWASVAEMWAKASEEFAQKASASETKAKTSEKNAKSSETKAKTSEENAKTSETNAKTSEDNAKTSETNAKISETNAATSESNAKTSENNAKTYMDNAESYKDQAATSASNANSSKNAAASSATSAANSATAAQESAQDAWDYANAVNPEKLVHKESNVEGSIFDFGDQFVRKDSEEQTEVNGVVDIIPEGEERTMMSTLLEDSSIGTFLFVGQSVPTSSTSTGIKGQVAFDDSYIYLCVADNSWKRIALSDL